MATVVDRVKAILLSPKTEWPVIEAEPGNIGSIYRNYLLWLAAITPIAVFIGLSVFGIGGFGFSYRVPFFGGLISAIVSYVVWLVMAYVIALIVDALAPTFGGQKNLVNAFKLVAYGSTASLVAGSFYVIPSLGILAFIGGLYSIYLIYLGLPVLMKCPPGKALVYTIVVLVCGFIAGVLVSLVSRMFVPGPGPMQTGDAGNVTITTPGGKVTLDTRKMEEAARKMEEAGKQMEQAGKSTDPAAAGKAVAEALSVLGAATGGREPIPVETLKEKLPESIAGLKRESFETQGGAPMGIKGTTAKAEYRDGDKSLRLEITDVGGLAGVMAFAGGWMSMSGEKDNASESEKIYKRGNRTIKEHVSKASNDGQYTVVLGNGIIVEGRGRGLDLGAVKKAVESLDIDALEATKAKG